MKLNNIEYEVTLQDGDILLLSEHQDLKIVNGGTVLENLAINEVRYSTGTDEEGSPVMDWNQCEVDEIVDRELPHYIKENFNQALVLA